MRKPQVPESFSKKFFPFRIEHFVNESIQKPPSGRKSGADAGKSGAERNADEKIAELQDAKAKIGRARRHYESKRQSEPSAKAPFIKVLPRRVILLSESMERPAVDNLWNYHRHFYGQLPESMKEDFSFEDMAGIYEQNGQQQLFAVCTKYKQTAGLKTLPQGKYLCANCTEENRKQVIEDLLKRAKAEYGVRPGFTVQMVVISGILQWNYQAQVFLSE